MVRILEQLQFGVHRADAVHGREAELDVGGDVASHEGFLNSGRGEDWSASLYSAVFCFCITVYPSLRTERRGLRRGGSLCLREMGKQKDMFEFEFQYLSFIPGICQQQDLCPCIIQL